VGFSELWSLFAFRGLSLNPLGGTSLVELPYFALMLPGSAVLDFFFGRAARKRNSPFSYLFSEQALRGLTKPVSLRNAGLLTYALSTSPLSSLRERLVVVVAEGLFGSMRSQPPSPDAVPLPFLSTCGANAEHDTPTHCFGY